MIWVPGTQSSTGVCVDAPVSRLCVVVVMPVEIHGVPPAVLVVPELRESSSLTSGCILDVRAPPVVPLGEGASSLGLVPVPDVWWGLCGRLADYGIRRVLGRWLLG